MTDNYDDLKKLTGQEDTRSKGTGIGGLPELRINRDYETADNKPLKPGTYKLRVGEEDVYASQVTFRPFVNAYQYIHFDGPKYINKSVIFYNWGEEQIDELGGIACGKTQGKVKKAQLSPQQLENEKKIKARRVMFGEVTFKDGTTVDGTKVEVKAVPCVFNATGLNYNAFGEMYESITKQRKLLPGFNVSLTTVKNKTGSNTYFTAKCDVDFSNEIPVDAHMKEQLTKFSAVVASENKGVKERYDGSVKAKGKATPTETDQEVASALKGLEDDLNDDVPDLTKT